MRNSGFTVLELIVTVVIVAAFCSILYVAIVNGLKFGNSATVWKPGCVAHNFRESTSHPGIAYCANCLKIAKIEFAEKEPATDGR